MKRHLVRSAATLVPLHIAVRRVYAAVYRRSSKDAASHERLGDLAQAMVTIIPLYTIARGDIEPRRFAESELHGGTIRLGGKELHFTDGRPPITSLLMTPSGIEHVIKVLQSVPPGEEMPMDPEAPARSARLGQ
jgi:hypothetical protein